MTDDRRVLDNTDSVLVVDDDAAMGGSIVEILGLSSIAAAAVTTGSAAITSQRELRPAAIICDQRLPDMTGLELCAAIRSIDPDVSLILLTGHASLDSAIAAVGQIDQYLIKPATPEELVRSVVAGIERTAARRAERQEAEHASARLAAIVNGTPDAVVSMSLDGTITGFNPGAEALYGYDAAEVIGQHASVLIPADRAEDLVRILDEIREGRHVQHFETLRVRKDGTVLNVSLTASPINDAGGTPVGASSIARDITDRIAATELRQQLDTAAERQRQAMQINDSIVQYLVVAQARLEVGDRDGAAAALDESLTRARGLIDDLVPAAAGAPHPPKPQPDGDASAPLESCRVVIADDSADIRDLVRMLLELGDGFNVVAEAADGNEAIAAAGAQQPDLVLLDHSMPNLDGLTALPAIREAAPRATVIMLSGFSADRLEDSARERGAAAYITKANLAADLIPQIQRVMGLDVNRAAG